MKKHVSIKEAVSFAGVSESTIKRFVKKHRYSEHIKTERLPNKVDKIYIDANFLLENIKVSEKYYLYILVKDMNPVYVGVTNNLKVRKRKHQYDKEFDSMFVLKSYGSKQEALSAENAIIKLNGVFDIGLMNAKLAQDSYVLNNGSGLDIERFNNHR